MSISRQSLLTLILALASDQDTFRDTTVHNKTFDCHILRTLCHSDSHFYPLQSRRVICFWMRFTSNLCYSCREIYANIRHKELTYDRIGCCVGCHTTDTTSLFGAKYADSLSKHIYSHILAFYSTLTAMVLQWHRFSLTARVPHMWRPFHLGPHYWAPNSTWISFGSLRSPIFEKHFSRQFNNPTQSNKMFKRFSKIKLQTLKSINAVNEQNEPMITAMADINVLVFKTSERFREFCFSSIPGLRICQTSPGISEILFFWFTASQRIAELERKYWTSFLWRLWCSTLNNTKRIGFRWEPTNDCQICGSNGH